MKKKLLPAIIMALSLVPSIAQGQNWDFSAVNDDGVTLYYLILSEENKTCATVSWDDDFAYYIRGDIVVPEYANGYKVVEIGLATFCYQPVTSVSIPETVTKLGFTSFWQCSISSITIPKSVTSIEDMVFARCEKLSTVTSFITDVFEIPEMVFGDSGAKTLYVPYGLSETYKATPGWNVFENIVEMDPASVPMQIACNTKGSVTINNRTEFTKGIGTTNIFENADNTFTFTPKSSCRLDQVILNGLDITSNVEGNTLTCTIPANSQMIVTFTNEQGDITNDGRIDISDVVAIVNKVLGIQ